MEKTIKQLADELGVSKQAIQKRLKKLPDNQQPTKVNGTYLLNDSVVSTIRKAYLKGKEGDNLSTNQQPTSDNVGDNLIFKEVIADLKNDKINLFDSIKEKDDQIKQLQKLLDQQQVLTLQANKKIEQLELTLEQTDEEELKMDERVSKNSFWSKLFQ